MDQILIRLGAIAIGGGAGAILRYLLNESIYKIYHGMFPLGTFTVNLIGSLVIGFLFALFDKIPISSDIRSFLFAGLIGSFTTFSTYILETVNLIRIEEFKLALLNILLSNTFPLLFGFIGFYTAKVLLKLV